MSMKRDGHDTDERGIWTSQQWDAIRTTGTSLLVSAAAGSGKTAVLAERCAYLVCKAEPRCAIDELLVVTFTNAAASEMRGRIERALRDQLNDSDDPHVQRQLALIERANISTLHGFCSHILRQHFYLLGIDPGFMTLDEQEAALLRREVARDLFADHYAAKDAGDFQRFIDHYGDGNDEPLIDRVIQTHHLLCSVVDPRAWVNEAMKRINGALKDDLSQSDLGIELAQIIACGLADLRRRAIEASGRLSQMQGLDHYAEYINELLAVISDWQERFGENNFDALSEAVQGYEMPRLPSVRGIDPGVREAGKAILDSVRDAMGKGLLCEVCRFSIADWRGGLERIATPTKVFLDLALEFSRRYQAAKDELRSIDFSDLERFALKILRDPADQLHLIPSDAAKAYHAQFKHVLVDEYQDINPVQNAILTLLSRECLETTGENAPRRNLFCVGDVKQSIYRFRVADPAQFLTRMEQFRSGDGTGQVIDLQSNFRTRGPLIDVLNGVFERLMTLDAAEIAYDASHQLRSGMDYPGGDGYFAGAPVELHLLPRQPSTDSDSDTSDDEIDLDRSEREGVVIAHRIRQLMGMDGSPRSQVFEKSPDGSLRPREIRFGDIAILLRSMKVKADQFAEQLRLAGIPVHSDSGTGFFESMEVRDILSLLRLLDNQRQDIPMAAVLRSPLANLPGADDCLAKIRLATRSSLIPFHEAVVRYAESGNDEIAACLRDFLDQLGKWRELAHRRPLAEVLWKIYDETGYLAFCGGLEDGEQRVANLIALHERARQFGTFQRQGLGRFMQFLENLQSQSDLGQPSVASEADDVVKIMSVHKAKGLEFPVVILPDLGKRHNLSDSRGMILVDRQAYVGLKAVDEEKRIRYPSLPWVLARNRLNRQMLAEELRVLYVAMTRAREHLILLGTCDDKKCVSWADWKDHAGPLPADVVLCGQTMLDWIGPVSAAIEAARPGSFKVESHTDEELAAWANQSARPQKLSGDQTQFAQLKSLVPPPPPNADAQRVIEQLTQKYRWDDLTRLSATESVTGLTKSGRAAPGGESASIKEIVAFDPELALPRCVELNRKPSATEIGSATHLVLQYLDFTASADRKQIERQIDDMRDRKLIGPNERDMVDVEAIVWLSQSELGQLLRNNAAKMRRETPVYFPMAQKQAADDPMDRVMVRGRLDVMVQTSDGLLIADYKTDRVTEETVDARVDFYRPQMQSYAEATKRITGKEVKKIYLAFLAPRILKQISASAPLPP